MVLRSSTKSEGQAGLKSLPHHQREELEMKLAETCEHCSYRERLAAEAERESIRIKQVRLMQTLIGREFLGRINGVSPGGAYVQMSEPYVEGFIPVESLGDDFFEFIEDKMILLGRRSRRVLRIGEEIKIQVVRADLERRQVEFALADSKN
jgi:ribonuclease R